MRHYISNVPYAGRLFLFILLHIFTYIYSCNTHTQLSCCLLFINVLSPSEEINKSIPTLPEQSPEQLPRKMLLRKFRRSEQSDFASGMTDAAAPIYSSFMVKRLLLAKAAAAVSNNALASQEDRVMCITHSGMLCLVHPLLGIFTFAQRIGSISAIDKARIEGDVVIKVAFHMLPSVLYLQFESENEADEVSGCLRAAVSRIGDGNEHEHSIGREKNFSTTRSVPLELVEVCTPSEAKGVKVNVVEGFARRMDLTPDEIIIGEGEEDGVMLARQYSWR